MSLSGGWNAANPRIQSTELRLFEKRFLTPFHIRLVRDWTVQLFERFVQKLRNLDDHGAKFRWIRRDPKLSTRAHFRVVLKLNWSDLRMRWVCILATVALVLQGTMVAVLGVKVASSVPESEIKEDVVLWGLGVGAMVCAAVTLGLILSSIFTGGGRKAVRDFYLSRRQCPGCFSDLDELAVADDGCVVCGNIECGAAWRLSDRVAQD